MVKSSKIHYDRDTIKAAARGREMEMVQNVGQIAPEYLNDEEGPCPWCGGETRFRVLDRGTGAVRCSHCFADECGDFLSAIKKARNVDFPETLRLAAEYLDVPPSTDGKHRPASTNLEAPERDPDSLAVLMINQWCEHKQGVTPEAVAAAGGYSARVWNRSTIVFPAVSGDRSQVVGYDCYQQSGKPWSATEKLRERKSHNLAGSSDGLVIVGGWDRFDAAHTIVGCEGVPDALAVHRILPDGFCAVAGIGGAGSGKAAKELAVALSAKDKHLIAIYDCDVPGRDGAKKLLKHTANAVASFRDVVLPFPLREDHGQDLRDWINEGNGWTELESLIEATAPIDLAELAAYDPPKVLEAIDDPHRLAKVNLARYSEDHGGSLICWQREIYQYKGGRYSTLDNETFLAKLTAAVKAEFDRVNVREQIEYQDWRDSDEYDESKDKGPPIVRKVTRNCVANVAAATRSICTISDNAQLNSWIDLETRAYQAAQCIAFQNGILDIEALLNGGEIDDVLKDHSPAWFSTIKVPYEFRADAKCPTWWKYLERVVEGDPERMDLLQEWAGYLLTPDTGQQRFLALEGEGANGKSVFLAGVEAILGVDNCSHVPLEQYAEKFAKTQTLGKLANLSTDVGELDAVAEATIKSFTSGERMQFDRKFLPAIEAYPTARLMVAFNNRPRFSDKSSGLWRRMILVPFRVTIPEHERVQNMDKPWWWEQSGELPGMFLWAAVGLHRLRQHGRFTSSALCGAAVRSYQDAANPAAVHLREEYVADADRTVQCAEAYDRYKRWCTDNGYRPLGHKGFWDEIVRKFGDIKRERRRVMGERVYMYVGIRRTEAGDQEADQ